MPRCSNTSAPLELDGSNRLAARSRDRARKDDSRSHRGDAPETADRRAARPGARAGTPLLSPTAPLPVVSFGPNASVRDILNFIGDARPASTSRTIRRTRTRPTPSRLEDVTLEQALQQIIAANQLFYKVLNPKTIIIVPDNAAEARAVRRPRRARVLHFARGRVGAGADHQHDHAHSDDAGASRRCCRTRRPTRSPSARRRLSSTSSNGSSARTTSRARKSSSTCRFSKSTGSASKELGLNLSNYSLGLTFSPEVAPPNTSGTPTPGNPPPFNLNTISQGISTADFYLSVPTAVVKFLESDSHTKVIAKPQLRGAEGTKLTMNLGDQIPVLSTVFGAQVPGGIASVPQSSFNYKDVGVNLEMTPRVTYEGEIILDGFMVESSALGAEHQRGRTGRAVVQLAQGQHEASAARRGVDTPRGAVAGRAAQNPDGIPRHHACADPAIALRADAATKSTNPTS